MPYARFSCDRCVWRFANPSDCSRKFIALIPTLRWVLICLCWLTSPSGYESSLLSCQALCRALTLIWFSTTQGHYKPTEMQLIAMLRFLRKRGFKLRTFQCWVYNPAKAKEFDATARYDKQTSAQVIHVRCSRICPSCAQAIDNHSCCRIFTTTIV